MPNPYNYSTVVTDPNMFFGREAVLRVLYTRLTNMQSTSVVGLRRIGKSSLLYQLARTLPDTLGQDYVPLYIDLQDPRYRTVSDFVQTVAVKLNQNMDGAAGIQVDVSSQEGASRQEYLVGLRQILDTSFDEGELRTICFDLGADYENLPGEGKANKARELVVYLERRGRIPELVKIGVQLRPNEYWEDSPELPRGIRSTFQKAPFERVREIFIGRRLRGNVPVSSVTDMASFSGMLHDLSHTGIRPVLCLDEFEQFMRHSEEFNDDFLEALRSLGGHSRLAIVTASRAPLVDLMKAGQWTSPFDNIFSQTELGLLEHNAARELRRAPFERDGIPLTPEHEALIEELGGRHPFFLQMVCHHLYEAFPGPQTRWADIVRECFNHDAEPHFDRLWKHLHAREQLALRSLVGQESRSLGRFLSALKALISQDFPPGEAERVFERLKRLGVVERRDGEWQPFSQAFAEHVQQYHTPKRR
jgi:AAA+ ATPase superfamily predicted ATPase